VTVAAGNGSTFGAQDACSVSPARVPKAVTVAATDSADRKPSWSNYGPCVDLFAPGAGIVSADGAGSGTGAWASMSGTSMAAPHVAGAAALILSAVPWAAPAKVRDALVAVATAGKVTSARTTNPKLLFAPFDIVPGELPAGVAPTPPTTSPPTTAPPSTTTTTRRCYLFCSLR
jgi:subtilisin family serine protease